MEKKTPTTVPYEFSLHPESYQPSATVTDWQLDTMCLREDPTMPLDGSRRKKLQRLNDAVELFSPPNTK